MARLSLAVAAATLAQTTIAVPWLGARKTVDADVGVGRSPNPTQAPMFAAIDYAELFGTGLVERQVNDRTCGYIDGIRASSVTCDLDAHCATNSVLSLQACCAHISDCYAITTCVPRTQQQFCNDRCQSDTGIVKCTGTEISDSECVTGYYTYNEDTTYTQYVCGEFSGIVHVSARYIGYTGSLFVTPTPSQGPSGPTSPTPRSSTIHSTPLASGPGASGGHQSASQSSGGSSSSSSNNNSGGGSSTNVGAIVGGVVGGLAVIAILVGFIVYVVINRRRKAADSGDRRAQAGGPGDSQSPSMPSVSITSPTGPNSYYSAVPTSEKDAGSEGLPALKSPSLGSPMMHDGYPSPSPTNTQLDGQPMSEMNTERGPYELGG